MNVRSGSFLRCEFSWTLSFTTDPVVCVGISNPGVIVTVINIAYCVSIWPIRPFAVAAGACTWNSLGCVGGAT
jgi:hypothetical protein